jgi:hypothetical protein
MGLPPAARRLVLIALPSVLIVVGTPGPLAGAVVVELFTAQGCSTCPPADRLLSAMGKDPDLGRLVVPLAFHVDYWNHQGWRDRFSDARWTQRQAAYIRVEGGERVYTPHAVVNGRRHCLGGDVQCIRQGVEAAAAQAAGKVELSLAEAGTGALRVVVTAQFPAGGQSLDVMLAVFESGLETAVARGENARKTLHNDFVVRRLQRAFKLSGTTARQETVSVKLEPEWQRGNLGVAVFLQDPRSQQIFAAASVAVTGAPQARLLP